MARPNRTFVALVLTSFALFAAIAWSTHHLLLAGAPGFVFSGVWPGLECLLVPGDRDVGTHLASYIFLGAIAAGTISALATLLRQYRQTRGLLRTCLALHSPRWRKLRPLARKLGLEERLDTVDSSTPLAFCYGYVRPRILVSSGLIARLSHAELEGLLLHEREHLRQRDPLKVAAGRLLVCALFFMPLVAALHRRYLVEKELTADRAAIEEQGQSHSLASALIHLIQAEPTRPVATAGADEALEARIDALLGDPVHLGPQLRPSRVGGSVAIAVVALLPLVTPMAQAAPSVPTPRVVDVCHPSHSDAGLLFGFW